MPHYQDAIDADVFILSGAEDLLPLLEQTLQNNWERKVLHQPQYAPDYHIDFYRPRIEGLFAGIERWTHMNTGDVHCRSISKDNITTIYGKSADSKIYDPEDPSHIFSWLIHQSYDDKGNAIVYEYKKENSANVDLTQVNEKNRTPSTRATIRYLKRIKYGNRKPNRNTNWQATDPTSLTDWMFEVIFDYDENHLENISQLGDSQTIVRASKNPVKTWSARQVDHIEQVSNG